ncbi:helix-hairpin-helix domain-containing protein [Micromonospora sp. DT47]|uniref:helix-hairpin-helix domain-containing protein n=1 Tax=Micromonospora sp. DT47 TaxID=3393431 RepID=UPI003CED0944
MPSSFGQWLIVILALLVGLAGGWALRGRQAGMSTPQGPSIMGDDPVVGLSDDEKATAAPATVDTPRPEATVDATPAPAAVVDEATPRDLDAPPAAASLAAHHTPLPTGDDAVTATDLAATDRADEDAVDTVPDTRADDQTHAADNEVLPATAIPAPRAAVDDTAPPAEVALPTDSASEVDVSTDAAQPAPVAAAVTGGGEDAPADDFRRIQGVGPKMAAALQDAGIRTYHQLAELDEAALRDTIRAAGLRAAPSVATWPQQAKVLAGASAEAGRVLPAPTGSGDEA